MDLPGSQENSGQAACGLSSMPGPGCMETFTRLEAIRFLSVFPVGIEPGGINNSQDVTN